VVTSVKILNGDKKTPIRRPQGCRRFPSNLVKGRLIGSMLENLGKLRRVYLLMIQMSMKLRKTYMQMAAKQSQGSFKPQRERDILTAGLGNPEHPGHVRGISSKEGWKEGLGPQWEGLYKKRDRYKEELSDYFKQEAKKEFKDLMSQMLSNPPLELMQQLASVMSIQ
jgi:hypothetical protein